jgi:hypothetical protein
MNMNGAVMTLARWHARQAVKRQLYAQGIKLQSVESCEITIAANQYVVDHPEIITFATQNITILLREAYCDPRES